jgi:alpha-soluble NSF attachment protein
LQADPPDLSEAASIFESIGSECLSNNLLKFQSKSHFFDAILCILAKGDVVAADISLNKYKDMDYTFPGCRECKLCEDIVQAYKDMNVDAFTDAVYNYDQISKLDPWRTS